MGYSGYSHTLENTYTHSLHTVMLLALFFLLQLSSFLCQDCNETDTGTICQFPVQTRKQIYINNVFHNFTSPTDFLMVRVEQSPGYHNQTDCLRCLLKPAQDIDTCPESNPSVKPLKAGHQSMAS